MGKTTATGKDTNQGVAMETATQVGKNTMMVEIVGTMKIGATKDREETRGGEKSTWVEDVVTIDENWAATGT